MKDTPEYSKFYTDPKQKKFGRAWGVCKPGTLYIKIDDDVVSTMNRLLFGPAHTLSCSSRTIPFLRLCNDYPSLFLVSADVVNQPAFGWVHYHLSAMHPYLPETIPPASNEKLSWRPSTLPPWTGPSNFKIGTDDPAPFPGHRWLPLDPTKNDLNATPIVAATYEDRSPLGISWPMAAQIHSSFLQNLEVNELHRYKFDMWDYNYDRISINFIAICGDDVAANYDALKSDVDEVVLTMKVPRKTGRHCVMDGRGLAVHFGFHKQAYEHGKGGKGRALLDTDLASRYYDFAKERVCQKPRSRSIYVD